MVAALSVVGNASSVHTEGRRARAIVETAREQVAALIGAQPQDVAFTSGATEANNWAVRGGWDALAVGATEHDSVLAPAHAVDPEVIALPSHPDGLIDLSGLPHHAAFSHPTPDGRAWRNIGSPSRRLLSLQLANPETGVLQPIRGAVATARQHGWLVHTDAVQAVGRILVDFDALDLDLMSMSSHKIGGPKGAGALVIRDGLDLAPLLAGGGQERRRRAGTENVAAIAGFGAAAETTAARIDRVGEVVRLRECLESGIRSITPEAVVVGATTPRLPNTSCIALAGAQAATLLIRLDLAGIAVGAGSACSSGKIGRRHVLAAMGLDPTLAAGAIRISLGMTTTEADVEAFLRAWQEMNRSRPSRPPGRDNMGASARPFETMRAGE